MSDHTPTIYKRKQEVICGIYMITCLAGGERYIGSSYDIYKRLREHLGHLVRNDHVNHYLQAAWNRYGEFAFKIEILEECRRDQRNQRERELIAELEPEWNLKLPNVERDTWTASDETRARISAAGRGKSKSEEHRARIGESQIGKRLSEETKAKISAAHIGKKLSEEHKRKVSETSKGRIKSPETRAKLSAANKGRVFTPEHLANLSAAHKGYVTSEETKRKLSERFKGRYVSPETVSKRKATWVANRRRERDELQGRLF